MKHLKLILSLLVLFFTIGVRAETNDQLLETMKQRMAEQQIQTDLQNPKQPVIEADRAVLGNRQAPIQIVTYSDFQCPFCQKGFENVEEVRKKYGKKILYVFKNFPLPFPPLALPAAKRFVALTFQSSATAYKFHDYVFKNQSEMTSKGEAFLDGAAKAVGGDVARMKKDMELAKVKTQIDADTAEAQKFEFAGTPGFIVAGVALRGAYPPAVFETIIDGKLKKTSEERKVTAEK